MNSEALEQLYGTLRHIVLSRHFAMTQYYRTNFISLRNDFVSEEIKNTNSWDVKKGISHDDNPLMASGWLMTCLAIEHVLGNKYSILILRRLIESLGTLFKFSGNHFDGYIIRFDAICTNGDSWKLDPITRKPQFCKLFPLGANGEYLYCPPLDDPRFNNKIEKYARLCRGGEPSQDELTGLIMGYHMVYQLIDDTTADGEWIREEIKNQATKLGDYLAEHGYFLVRPTGGFIGHAQQLEYPAGVAFTQITGQPFAARADFVGACQKADVWKCLEGPINWGTVGGIAVETLLMTVPDLFTAALGGVSLAHSVALEAVRGLGVSGIDLGRAAGMYSALGCFSLWGEHDTNRNATEMPLAFLLSRMNPKDRYLWSLRVLGLMGKGFAVGFFPFTALMGFGAGSKDEKIISDTYFSWLTARRMVPNLDDSLNYGVNVDTIRSAVAVLLGAGEDEENHLIDKIMDGPIQTPKEQGTPQSEIVLNPLNFMLATSLSWLHAKRQQESGKTLPTDFPEAPRFDSEPLRKPSIPESIIEKVKPNGTFQLPVQLIQGAETPIYSKQEENEPEEAIISWDISKSPEPAPIVPPYPDLQNSPPIFDRLVEVNESDADVDTGVLLQSGDVFSVEATGDIYAGDILIGRNGPEGCTDRVTYHTKFPLHGCQNAYTFGLLGKIVDYFFIGQLFGPYRFFNVDAYGDGDTEWPLYLRINDDTPGGGNGQFHCRVRVWRWEPASPGPSPQPQRNCSEIRQQMSELRIKLDELLERLRNSPSGDPSIAQTNRGISETRQQLHALAESAHSSECVDSYSYYGQSDFREFNESSSGQFSGVGGSRV